MVVAFSSRARILGECSTVQSSPGIIIIIIIIIILSGDLLAPTNSTLLGQDQSTAAQRAETTVTECSPMSCV